MRGLCAGVAMLAASVMTIGVTASPAHAQTFQLGTGLAGNSSNAWGMSGVEEAQQFHVGQAFVLTSASIRTSSFSYTGPSFERGFQGFFSWTLYAAAAATPGTALASGMVVPDRTPQYVDPVPGAPSGSFSDVSDWTFALPNLLLARNTSYWLGLRNTDALGNSALDTFYWDAAIGADPSTFAASAARSGGGWGVNPATDDEMYAYGNRLTLNLYGATVAPEPSSVVLSATALTTLLLALRRRRSR